MESSSSPGARDWKVSAIYRVMVNAGWILLALSLYEAVAAVALQTAGAWWAAAGFAAAAIVLGVALPEVLPADLITGSRRFRRRS